MKILILFCLLLIAGCSTLRPKSNYKYVDLFSNIKESSLTANQCDNLQKELGNSSVYDVVQFTYYGIENKEDLVLHAPRTIFRITHNYEISDYDDGVKFSSYREENNVEIVLYISKKDGNYVVSGFANTKQRKHKIVDLGGGNQVIILIQ